MSVMDSWLSGPIVVGRWDVLPIRRVGTLLNGGTPTVDAKNWGGNIPFVTPPDLNGADGAIVSGTGRTLTAEGAKASGVAPAGSVVVSTRAPIGHVGRVVIDSAFNQGCRAVSPAVNMDGRFLAYAVVAARPELDARGLGTTFVELSGGNFAAVPVPVPPQGEQRRIADFLDAETARIDTLITEQERFIDLLRERRQASISRIFERSPGTLSTKVGYLLSGRPTYGVLVPRYVDEVRGVPFIRVGDTHNLDSDKRYLAISHEQSAEYSRTRLRGGEVLLGVVGKMGQATVAPEWLAGANVARALAVLRCVVPADAPLLCAWFSTGHFRAQADFSTSGDTVQPTLGMQDLSRFEVHWPTGAVAAQHALDRAGAIDTLIDETEHNTMLLMERRSALITAAVTGQIDVSTGKAALMSEVWRDDNPI